MFKTLTKGCEPTRGSKFSACVDLYSAEDVVIGAGETAVIELGVCIDFDNWFRKHKDFMNETYYDKKIPEFKLSHYLQLNPRSSLRAKGLLSNTGIIDLDYENEIKIIIHNPIKIVDAEYSFSDEFLEIDLLGSPNPYALRENTIASSSYKIKKGDKIAQIMLMEHRSYLFGIYTNDERNGGFGSTGK